MCQTGSNKRCLADGKYEEKGKFNSSYLLVEEGGECVSGVTLSLCVCVCVVSHRAHVDVVKARNNTAVWQSVRLVEDRDRHCVNSRQPRHQQPYVSYVFADNAAVWLTFAHYVLYISATSCHHYNRVREARERKGGERRSGVLLKKTKNKNKVCPGLAELI